MISGHESELGILLLERREPKQGAILRDWMEARVLPAFEERILPIDTNVVLRSARLHMPEPRPLRDTLIAATALIHRMTVVTRDASDYAGTGVLVLNP